MTKLRLLLALFCVPLLAVPAQANILDDFNSGKIVTDFQFDDAVGTQIPDAINSAVGGGAFDVDTDNDDVVTNGNGQLDASAKANTELGSNYVDLASFTTGRVIGLFYVSWAFDESVYDPAQDEEFRLTLITNNPRSTFVTSEIFFTRTSATEVTLLGNGVGTGATDTPDTILGSSGDLLTMIDTNLATGVFELFASTDGGINFSSLGTGTTDPTRGISSVRLVINEDYTGDRLLIDRFAVSVIPEPASVMVLAIGLATLGAIRRIQRA